jgi:hypothetical protein
MCTSPAQLRILRQPGRPVWHVAGSITGQQIVSQRPAYINALLIQSRGNLLVRPCDTCAHRSRPFHQCIRLPGEFGGCCGNCKWRDRACWCSVRDGQPRNATQPWPMNPLRALPAVDVIDLTDEQPVVRLALGPSRRAQQHPRADSEVQEMSVVDLTEDVDAPVDPCFAWYTEEYDA